jgi:hypothetical protein
MGNAFPFRSDCPDVPVVEAITGHFVTSSALCVPPNPISSFPIYEFPPPDPPSADFGCYGASLSAQLDIKTDPSLNARIEYSNSADIGKCLPVLKMQLAIPPCASAAAQVTTSTVPALTEPSADFNVSRNPDEGDICKLAFDLKLYFPSFGGGGGNCSTRAATTGDNISLSGLQTIDGVALPSGSTVLVKDQTNPAENGTYTVSGGAWSRTCTMAPGVLVSVRDGDANGGTAWQLNVEGPINLGVTALLFGEVGPSCCCHARAATTENIALSGEQTIDGIALVDGEVCLVKDQTVDTENGPYIVHAGAWKRTCNIASGMLVSVREGNTYAISVFMLTTNDPIVVDTTPLEYEQTPVQQFYVVKAASLTNIASLSGSLTVDGMALVSGDLILVRAQSTAAENGVYMVQSGAWQRLAPGALPISVQVRYGTSWRGTIHYVLDDLTTWRASTAILQLLANP